MPINIYIAGVGGQGTITLKRILSYAAIKEGEFFRSSEIRGLAQRGGSVNAHFRSGKIDSPLISKGDADLIFGLDLLEAARSANFASSKTAFVVNDHFITFTQLSEFTKKEFLEIVEQVTKNIFTVDAAKICLEQLGKDVYSGVFLLGLAFAKNLVPFKEESLIYGIEKSSPDRFVADNVKAFNLGKDFKL